MAVKILRAFYAVCYMFLDFWLAYTCLARWTCMC